MISISLFYWKVFILSIYWWLKKFIKKETSLPKTGDFYSHVNMEVITGANYVHRKRVCKDFEIKKLERIFWFICYTYVIHQSDTLSLADAFDNFRRCFLKYLI